MTPPQRSVTPAPAPTPAPEPEPAPVEELPAPLPKSISAGKPLPTVDSPQPDDLSLHDFQTVTERYVLSCAPVLGSGHQEKNEERSVTNAR